MMRTRGSTGPMSTRAAGLEQDGAAGVGQAGHEREDLGLQERLAAGDLDEAVAQGHGPVDDLVERQGLALLEGVRRVAVAAPQVAGGQPDEDAGESGEVLSPCRLR